MKILVVIALCIVSTLGVGQIALLNDSTIGAGLLLQSGETVIIGVESSVPSNALMNEDAVQTLKNENGTILLVE